MYKRDMHGESIHDLSYTSWITQSEIPTSNDINDLSSNLYSETSTGYELDIVDDAVRVTELWRPVILLVPHSVLSIQESMKNERQER